MLDLKPNEAKRQAVERAIGMLLDMGNGDMKSLRGTVIPHHRLAGAFGVMPQTDPYYNLMDRLKRKVLAEHGISIEAVVTEGYQFNTPRGQLGNARSRFIQAARRYRKGGRIADALPTEECTEMTDLRVRAFIVDAAAAEERKARKLSRQAAFLSRPTRTREPIRLDESA